MGTHGFSRRNGPHKTPLKLLFLVFLFSGIVPRRTFLFCTYNEASFFPAEKRACVVKEYLFSNMLHFNQLSATPAPANKKIAKPAYFEQLAHNFKLANVKQSRVLQREIG
jgi:hypothetical protein